MALGMFLAPSVAIMSARVNQMSFSYPIAEVTMDNVSTNTDPGGDWQFVEPEMTVVFGTEARGDDLGRQRIRKAPTSNTLYFGRSSQGGRDGEVNLEDNAHITVFVDIRAWAKIPFINPATDPPTINKDHDLAAGTNVSQPPPQSNTGEPAIGFIDSGTSALRVTLPHEANTSWAVALGASISSYTWSLPDNGWLVSGTVNDSQITIDVPEGAYWISCLVEDSNSKQHRSWVPVVALNPDGSTPGDIDDFEIVDWEITPQGQRVSVRVLGDIDAGDFADGTLVVLYDGNMTSGTDRSNLLFWGWHQSDPQTIRSERTGIVRDVVLECVDIGGRLGILPGFPFIVGADPENFEGWAYMPDAEWRHFLTYHLKWHSNALDIADWLPSDQLATYFFPLRQTDAGNLYQQVNEQARSVCPDFAFTVTRGGQMLCRVDPMLQLPANRTSEIQVSLDEDNWREIQVTGHHWPRHHWLREEAIYAYYYYYEITPFFSIAPGETPGQGEGEASPREHLAQSQDQLNETTGQRYGRLNAPQSFFRVTLWSESDGGIEPATMRWVRLTIPEAYAAQRGLNFTNARGLVHSLTKRYRYTRTGVVVENSFIWERETEGIPGATYTQPEPSS